MIFWFVAIWVTLASSASAAVNPSIEMNPDIEFTGTGSTAHDCDDVADSCPAPTAVLFDATGTTCTAGECDDPFRELHYHWDFGDIGSTPWTIWATDGKSRTEDYGPVVTHVYDSAAGSPYTVTLTVTEPDGTAHVSTDLVYIADPDTAWPASVTTCATNENAVDVDFSWCPFACSGDVNCVCTNSTDSECDVPNSGSEIPVLLNAQFSIGKKRVLIPPGSTWNVTAAVKIDFPSAGPAYFGVPYGEANATIEHDVVGACNTSATPMLINNNANAGNTRWVGVDFDSTQVDVLGPTAAINVMNCGAGACPDNFLWLKSAVNDACNFWVTERDSGNTQAPYWVSGSEGGLSAYQFFIGDGHLMDSGGWDTGDTGKCGSGGGASEDCGYGILSQARYMAIQGLQFGDADVGNTAVWVRNRIAAGDAGATLGYEHGEAGRYSIQHNIMSSTKSGSATFRCHPGSGLRYVNLADNLCESQPLGTGGCFVLANTLTSRSAALGCSDILIERNIINHYGQENCAAKRLTIRNNFFGPSGNVQFNAGIGCIAENDPDPDATWAYVDDFYFVGNSKYGTGVEHIFTNGNASSWPKLDPDTICRNNVFWDTTSTTLDACADLPAAWFVNAADNDTNAARGGGEDVTLTTCPFYGATGTCDSFDWSDPTHWELNATAGGGADVDSPAAATGLFVYDDYLSRTRGASPDMGAMETTVAGGGASCGALSIVNGDGSACAGTSDGGTCTTATYTCDSGYTGSDNAICDNGTWIGSYSCDPDACASADLTITNGVSTPCDGTASGASCTTFTCNVGYTPSGSADCLAGTWSGDYACEAVTASCSGLVVNRGYGAPCDGTLDTQSCTDFTCFTGYVKSGSATCNAPVWGGNADCDSASAPVCSY